MRYYQDPSVTTIIPTFRRPALLARAIRSVLAQSYRGLQVLVCDNASGDETRQVVSSLAGENYRVSYYCQRENIGFVRNFNFGLSKVTTPYFSLLSDDDMLLPDFYATATRALERYPSSLIFAGMTREIFEGQAESRRIMPTVREGYYPRAQGFFALFEREATPRLWTGMLFRRELLSSVSCLDEALKTQHDHDFVMRACLRFPILVNNQICAHYYHHQGSIHVNTPATQEWEGWIQILRKTQADTEVPTPLRARAAVVIKRKLVEDIVRSALRSSRQGDFDQASEAVAMLKHGVGLSGYSNLLAVASADTALGRKIRRMVGKVSKLWRTIPRSECLPT